MYKTRSGTGNGTRGMGGMSPNIPGNVAKHSGECHQTFQGILPIFCVKEDNYWAGSHLESCQESTMELFCENSQRP